MPMAHDRVTPPHAGWPHGCRALTTTRHGPADPEEVAALGPGPVQWLHQVHGSHCIEASMATLGERPQADAAWTRQRHLSVCVVTADCVPVVLCDRDASVVGVAHGGWRGLVGGVLPALVNALPVPAAAMVAWLGPAIGPRAYEVGEDVAEAVAALPDGALLARDCLVDGRRPGKYQLDLFTLSERLLERAGVMRVFSDRLCTYSDGRFYSYRREGSTGRLVTMAWLG